MADPKQLKFQFTVDEASLQKTRQLIRELTSDLAKLNEQANKAGVGGIGGLGGGVNVSANGPKSPEAQRAIAKTAPAGRSLVQNLLEQEGVFKSISKGSKDSMKSMTDSVAQSVRDQKRHLSDLQKSVESISKAYGMMGGSTSFLSRISRGIGSLGNMASGAGGPPELLPDIPWPTRMGRFRSWLNGRGGGGGGGGGGAGAGGIGAEEAGAGGGGMMGGMAARFGGMGLAAGGVAVASYMLKDAANNWAVSPYVYSSMAAQHGAQMAGFVGGVKSGTDIRARRLIAQDAKLQDDYSTVTDPGMREGWSRGHGFLDSVGRATGGGLRSAGTWFSGVGTAFTRGGLKEAWSSAVAGDQSIDYQNVLKDRQRTFLDQTNTANSTENSILDVTKTDAAGRMGMMRALGLGAGWKNGTYRNGAQGFLNSFGTFSPGEVTGAVQGIAAQGTRRSAYGLTGTTLQAQAAGINGAAGFAGIMSRGGGSNFVDQLRMMAGGGVDVSTTGLFGGAVSGMADQMNLARGYSGTSGLLGAMSTGLGGADEGMVARQNLQGVGYTQNLLGGGRDNLQKAINLQIAMKNNPKAGFAAQRYLAQDMNVMDMAQTMSGHGQLSPMEKSMGITLEMKQAQAQGVMNSRMVRVLNDPNATNTGYGRLAAGIKASGMNLKDYVKTHYKGHMSEGIADTAALFKSMDPSRSESELMGAARMEILGYGKNLRKGKKAGDPGGGSTEAKQLQAEADQRKIDEAIRSANAHLTEDDISKQADAYKRAIVQAGNLGVSMKTLDAIVQDLGRTIQKATGAAPTHKGRPHK